MPNNNPNSQDWISRLDNNDDGSLEMSAAQPQWDKLYQRLHAPKNRRNRAWYWAAASLLICVLLGIVYYYNATVSNTLPNQAIAPKPQSPKLTVLNTPYKTDTLTSSNKQNTTKQDTRSQSNNLALPLKIKFAPLPVTTDSNSQPVSSKQEITSIAISRIDSNTVIAATRPLRSTLKVVHINELTNDNPYLIHRKTNEDFGAIQLGIRTQSRTVNPAPYSGKIGLQILTNKNSPLN
jgi:hypothetical protein